MAKIKAPLFSLDATGTLDKNITYKGKLRDQIAQKYSKPGDKNPFESSPRQKDQRSIIRLITIHWQCMSSADKLSWENAAKDVRFKGTGYHYFLHMAQQNLTQYLGLVGYWSMNYNIDEKIPDLSGNSNDGTLGPIYPCDCPQPIDSFDIKLGKALSFDGLDDTLDCGNNPSLQLTGNFTIEVLVSFDSAAGWRRIVSKDEPLNRCYYLHSYSGRPIVGIIINNIELKTDYNSAPDLRSTGWNHILAFREGSYIKLFINLILVASKFVGTDPTDNDVVDLFIGSRSDGVENFLGSFDEVYIWNRTLSSSERSKHYESYNL